MRDYRKSVQTDERKSGARDYRTSLSVLDSAAKAQQEQRTQQTSQPSPKPIDIIKPGQSLNPLQGTMDRVKSISQGGPSAPYEPDPIKRGAASKQLFEPKTLPGMLKIPQMNYETNYVAPLDSVINFGKQFTKGSQEAVLYDEGKPIPTTGSKRADAVARFIGNSTAGLATGQTELNALNAVGRGAESLAAKVAPGLVARLTGTAAEGAAQGAVGGAMLGQTSPKELATNAAAGAGLGALGRGVAEGFSGVANKLNSTARNLTQTNPVYKTVVQQVGEDGLRAQVGKQALNDIDSQLSVLNQRNSSTMSPTERVAHNNSLDSLNNERSATVDYIKQYEPEFAPNEVIIQRAGAVPTIETPRLQQAASVERQATNLPSPDRVLGERGHYRQLRDKGNLSEEFNRNLEKSDKTYEIATNKRSVEQANKNVENLTEAESNYLGNNSPGPADIATAQRLLQKLDALGEHQRSLNIANKLMKDLTKSGQTSQAASILSRLSPEGQLLNLTRQAAKNGKEVSIPDKVKFQELAAEVQSNSGAGIRENQFNSILDRVQRGENVSPEEMKSLGDFLERAKKVIKPKEKPIVDELPKEFKDVKKREKIVSFLDSAEQAALARIKARKTRLNALPFDEWADHAIVVASQIGKGTIKAATHVEDMVKLFGDEIRPVASAVFQKAQGLLKSVSRNAAEGKLKAANDAFRRLSGEAQAENAIVEETAAHVKKLIDDAKNGNIDPADIQKLRDYSDEIADFAKPSRVPTADQKFLQSVKALAKKIAQVETEKVPTDQANREVSSLLRQVAKLTDEAQPALVKKAIDTKAISDIAHDVLEKTRPTPKPTTLQEKIVEKYVKENPVSPDDVQKLRDLAKQVTALSGDDALNADMEMQKILNSYEKSSLWDKVQAIRYIAMLLNTSTQAVNAASGPIMATTGHVADVFGTMVDIAISKTLNQPRTTTLYGTNPLAFMARWFKGLKIGGKAGAQGVNPAGIAGTNEIRGLTYKSLYNPLGLAERGLGAVSKGADYATYRAVYQSEMTKQAFLDAKNKGIKGKANIQSHMQQFLNEPTPEAILQADRIGKNTTFQRSDSLGGSVANFLSNPNGKAKLLKPVTGAIFPFVRTPVNMASTAVTMTPGGIIKGLYQLTSKSDASRREAIRTLSMGLTGTGISALGFYLSKIGVIAGANDSGDKDVDAIREQAGQGKYRFNTSAVGRYMAAMINGEGEAAAEQAAKYKEGDKQFDYNKLQPLAFPLAIGAGLEKNKDKGAVGAVTGAGTDAYGSLYGMSTLKGVQDVFQPSYGGSQGEKALGVPSRIIESFVKSFSPSILGQEARREDTNLRTTAYNDGIIPDVKDYYMSRLPKLSQQLPASKTTLGLNKLNSPGVKGQYLNPYRSDKAPFNQAAVIISNLIDKTGDARLAPSAPDKKVSGTDRLTREKVTKVIPPARYAKLQEDVGTQIIQQVISIPSDWADDRKADRVLKIYETVRKREMDKVKRELGIRVSR